MKSNQHSAVSTQKTRVAQAPSPVQRTRDEQVLHNLWLAEIYLEDGAPFTALGLIRECLQLLDPALPAGEDLGDVSDHLVHHFIPEEERP